jgi:membrane-bound serine protease (ClpP class)
MNRHVGRSRARALARLLLGFGLGLLLVSQAASTLAREGDRVYVMPTTGIVDQIMQGYIRDGIAKAQRDGYAAVVIALDTPGGDLNATREIVKSLLNAPVPVIVWVGPSGGRAASAGTFITLAAHVAVMAPSTNIGAATPIDASGQDINDDLRAKILQDTQALLESISSARGRNVEWALKTVTDAESYTADEAVTQGGVDGIAGSVQDAIAFASGRTINLNGQTVALDLSAATAVDLPMNPLQSLLHLISDPNIAFILLTLGFYGLFFELQNPNWVTGILGGLSLILGFIGLGSLPVNVAGLLLIGLAIILFVLEFSVTSHGLLTVAGLVAFVLGAAALYTEPGTPAAPDVSVAWPVIAAMAALTGAFMLLIVAVAVRTRRMQTAEGLIGAGLPLNTLGEVRMPLTPIGSVYAGGEEWSAKAVDDAPLPRGTRVRVLRVDGLTAIVEPAEETVTPGPKPASSPA